MTFPDVRAALLDLHDQCRAAAAESDLPELARLIRQVEGISKDVAALDRDLRTAAYEASDWTPVVVPGVGTVQRSKPGKRDEFESHQLLTEVLEIATTDAETGEKLVAREVIDRVQAALELTMPVTKSLGWRRTGLTELGVDWRRLHRNEPGPRTVRLL